MSDSIYSFRAGPTYRGATQQETLTAALEMPMSRTSTFFDQAKGGILESFGLGTAIRDISIPEGKQEEDDGEFGVRDAMEMLSPHPLIRTYELAKRGVQSLINDEGSPALSEDAYKSSAWYREGVPWDQAMTEQRAAALAESFDAKKVREFYAEKRPITAFIGNLAGQAADPINYIPVAGPAVKAAAVARLGKVAGASVAASLDAAANTAIFGIGTAQMRQRFGDDVSWQTTVSQIATAALIGAGFGSIAGAIEGRGAKVSRSAIEERLATLKTTQEARIALNEGIDALARGEDVRLSPNVTGPIARIAAEVEGISRAYDEVRETPNGPVRDPLVRITPEDIEGTILARGSFKDINEVEISRRGWGLVKILWRHGEESQRPEELRINKDDVTALPEVIRSYEPSSVSNDGTQREWRVDRDGRTVVYADSIIGGERHVVTAYVEAPKHPNATKPLSVKRKPAAAGSSSDALNAVGDTNQGLSLRSPDGRPLPAKTNIARNVAVDNTAARVDPGPIGLKDAEKAVAKPDDYKALSSQYRVDPDTGAFAEEADIAQIGTEGRLTDDDVATLAAAQETYDNGAAYGEALKSLAGCLI